jgi:predicted RNA-binding protein YlqC (UPF0109 family)
VLDKMEIVESPVARGILTALGECWPEKADLGKVAIQVRDPRRIVVTVWTSTPGEVIGRGGSTASDIKERLRAVIPDKTVEFRVLAGAELEESEDHPRGEAFETGSFGRDLVPDLVGMAAPEAHGKARSSGFSLTTGDPDDVPISFYMANRPYRHWVVIGQNPLPGVLAPLHSQIVVALEERGGGGESGDREPRVPLPPGGIVHFEHPIDVGEERDCVDEVE